MSQICEKCGKKPVSGFNVSHSHRRTKRRFLPNLQKAKILIKGKEVSAKICTNCLKTLSKIPKEKKVITN